MGGRILRRLHDVVDILASGKLYDVEHVPMLKPALDLLLRAAESGHPDHLKPLTDHVAMMLKLRQLS